MGRFKRILIAPDSFKDCLSSRDVALFLGEGIKEVLPEAGITVFPVADGGDGTASCIHFHRGGSWKDLVVNDPLYRPVTSQYLELKDENTAVIELARASGLELLDRRERNALETSTFGTGELIRDALDGGIKKIILTIGGSATVDGGTGIASALGFRFTGKDGRDIMPVSGGRLSGISGINSDNLHPLFREAEILIACDVQNVLNGEEGAARVYGPQKGADEKAVSILESGLRHLSRLIFEETGFDADKHPGTGAAGGAALFLLAYGKGKLCRGFDIIMELTSFLDAVEKADLIISGEGKIDRQTAYGKVVSSIAAIAAKKQIPFAGVGGIIEGDKETLRQKLNAIELYPVRQFASNDADSFSNAPEYLRRIGSVIAENIIRTL